MIAGGPAASLLTALTGFALVLTAPGSSWESWWMAPALVAISSATDALFSLIPLWTHANFSDGALLAQLYRGGPFAKLFLAKQSIQCTAVSATRLRDIDANVLASAAEAEVQNARAAPMHLIRVVCALDRGDMENAREYLECALRHVPNAKSAANARWAAEIAAIIAYLDGDAGRAGPWLREAEQEAIRQGIDLTESFDYWKASMAVALAESREQDANEAWRQAMELAEEMPPAGLYEYEKGFLQSIKAGAWLRSKA